MSIVPLPVFEADADPTQRDALTEDELYARLEPPKTIVVRFGAMRLIGEYPYSGDAKPGCGSKLVARTHRGTEVVEMLTTTCGNAGCGKSITRKEMLDYVRASGGADYPFHREGRVLRVATIDDLNAQSDLSGRKPDYVRECRRIVGEFDLPMKVVDAEPILGGELLTFFYMAEERVDFRELVRQLAGQFGTRIEMRQVGARDEARLVADYERCGQYCCCKSFLKVLKPVSMRSAKTQKATLDPLKISGRCGRLMCCLRYEDETYTELRKRLPHRKSRVGTPEGPGIVIDSKILVQLVLVRLEADDREVAVAVEDLCDPENCPPPGAAEPDPFRGMDPSSVEDRIGTPSTDSGEGTRRRRRRRRRGRNDAPGADAPAGTAPASGSGAGTDSDGASADDAGSGTPRRRRRRRRGRGSGGGDERPGGDSDRPASETGGQVGGASGPDGPAPQGEKRRRRRRRRRRGGGGAGGADADRGGESD